MSSDEDFHIIALLAPDGQQYAKHVTRADDGSLAVNAPLNFLECCGHDYSKPASIDALEAMLVRALDRPRMAIMPYAEPVSGLDIRQPHRRLAHDKTSRATGEITPATYRARASRLLLIDVDSQPEPDGISFRTDPGACLDAVIACLPDQFHNASFVAIATGSAGIRPGIRLRLAFLLDRPISHHEARAWLAQSPVDLSGYSVVGLHILARPTFADGIEDPMPRRLFRRDRASNFVPVPDIAVSVRAPRKDADGERWSRARLMETAELLPNDDEAWDKWVETIGAFINAAEDEEDARAAAEAWSTKSGKHDPQDFDAAFDHVLAHPFDKIGGGSLVHRIREAGHPDYLKRPSLEESFGSIIGAADAAPDSSQGDAGPRQGTSDDALADQLAALTAGKWVVSDGAWFYRQANGLWAVDDSNRAHTLTRTFLRAEADNFRAMADQVRPADARADGETETETKAANATKALTQMLKEASRLASLGSMLETKKKIDAIYTLWSKDTRLAVRRDTFDVDPDLLGTPAGILDTKTGSMTSTSAIITKSVAVMPAGVPTPQWASFIGKVTGGDVAFARLLQQIAGAALSGDYSDKIFYAYGDGANGKSTFVRTLGRILGDYAQAIGVHNFAESHGHKTNGQYGISKIAGARFVTAEEAPPDATWNDGLLKSLTGGDSVEVREIYGRPMTIRSQATLLLFGNHLPRLKAVGPHMRRRLVLLPFTQRIVDIDGPKLTDRQVDALFEPELPGILQWALDGLAMLRANGGWSIPAHIQGECERYLGAQDHVGMFVEDRLVEDPDGFLSFADANGLFVEWCAANGVPPFKSERTLGDVLTERGFQRGKKGSGKQGTQVRGFAGLRKRSTQDVTGYTQGNVKAFPVRAARGIIATASLTVVPPASVSDARVSA